MKEMSQVFDIRWWEACRLVKIDSSAEDMANHVFMTLKRNLEAGREFIKGEKIEAIKIPKTYRGIEKAPLRNENECATRFK